MTKKYASKRCAVEGCKAWSLPGGDYCASHQMQYENNREKGLADPTPHLLTRNRKLCKMRGCHRQVQPGSDFCPQHAKALAEANAACDMAALGFLALRTTLEAQPETTAERIGRELAMLDEARKLLISQSELSSRNGWRTISAPTFLRLWIASADKANDLLRSQFVVENGTSDDIDGILGNVYKRLEAGPPAAQQQLPLPELIESTPTTVVVEAEPLVLHSETETKEGAEAEKRAETRSATSVLVEAEPVVLPPTGESK